MIPPLLLPEIEFPAKMCYKNRITQDLKGRKGK